MSVPENILVPSNKIFDTYDCDLLRLMAQAGFIEYREETFELKSGIRSHVYVHGRGDLTDNIELEQSIGLKIVKIVEEATKPSDGQVCLIGLPTAGTPFAQAAAMVAHFLKIRPNDQSLIHRIMKEKPKDYGANKGWFNGAPKDSQIYWRLDNVATNGATKIECEEKFGADGYPTVYDNPDKAPVLIWIDRQQGALDKLRAAGYTRIHVAYNLLDVTYAYGELGLWPESAVEAVEEEIKAHQALT